MSFVKLIWHIVEEYSGEIHEVFPGKVRTGNLWKLLLKFYCNCEFPGEISQKLPEGLSEECFEWIPEGFIAEIPRKNLRNF